MTRLLPLALAAGALAAGRLPAQAAAPAAHRGAFVVRRGADTVLVERFARDGATYGVEQAVRAPAPALYHTHVALAPSGDVESLFFMQHQVGKMDAPLLAGTQVTVRGDSATLVAKRGDTTVSTRRVAVRAGALPALERSYLAYELLAMRAAAAGQDSLSAQVVGPFGTATYTVRRLGPDSLLVGGGDGPAMRARVDAAGRILGLRTAGAAPLVVERVDDVDPGAIAARWAKAPARSAGHAH